MSSRLLVTRFAPSPSGELHLGNARTALFNFLLARRTGGRFLLRIEDTDASRSTPAFTRQLLDDLQWLGLAWDGEVVYQSARAAVYREALERLDRAGRIYPCYCTPLEIEVSRKAQLAAGRPPRYAGTCRQLDEEGRFAKIAEGRKPTLRFRVPDGGRIEFVDLVHGPQVFECNTIGDFILQRADGSAAFFFSNLVDDVWMGITTVLRGEDHLSNTPRQLLLAMALGCEAPTYGHLSLITGADGAPLSKRSGARSLRELREAGYRPEALANHLFRLGHSSEFAQFGTLEQLASAFDVDRLGRSPARFDPVQLDTWQKESLHRLPDEALEQWLAALWPAAVAPAQRRAFVSAVRANLVLPADAALWMQVVFGDAPEPDAAGRAILDEAGDAFFRAASEAIATVGTDWKALVAAVRASTGRQGPALFKPLRQALTGVGHGPELAALLPLITAERARERLQKWART
ncbi:MAG: glutamate--tRNA ligase [Steroidobacteraceae bacterium]